MLKEEAEAFLTDVVGDTLAQAIGSIDDATSQFGKEVVQTVRDIALGLSTTWSSDMQLEPTNDLQNFAWSLGAGDLGEERGAKVRAIKLLSEDVSYKGILKAIFASKMWPGVLALMESEVEAKISKEDGDELVQKLLGAFDELSKGFVSEESRASFEEALAEAGVAMADPGCSKTLKTSAEKVLDGLKAYMQSAKAKLEGVASKLMQLCVEFVGGSGDVKTLTCELGMHEDNYLQVLRTSVFDVQTLLHQRGIHDVVASSFSLKVDALKEHLVEVEPRQRIVDALLAAGRSAIPRRDPMAGNKEQDESVESCMIEFTKARDAILSCKELASETTSAWEKLDGVWNCKVIAGATFSNESSNFRNDVVAMVETWLEASIVVPTIDPICSSAASV